jgi:hypothetical protein
VLPISRREWLARCGTGIGTIALTGMLADDALSQQQGAADAPRSPGTDPLAPKAPHFKAKAKHVVHLFMNGGPSQVDTFDPKPLLTRYHGKPIPTGNLRTERKTGAAMGSPYKFRKYGQSGIEVSELFAKTAAHIDDMCIIRGMYADVPNHEPSLLLMNCGEGRQPRPSLGSWLTYGLGSENRNLPGFIVMCPGGYPIVTTQNWRSAFLPGVYQGTYIDSNHKEVEKLIANIRNTDLPLEKQREQLDLVAALNAKHLKDRGNDAALEARIRTFELAFRMQSEAADVFDLAKETRKVRDWYGDTVHGRQLLITRRLIERGVRVVQLWSGAGQPWDNHDGLEKQHRALAAQWDKPIAAFLTDLKARGLFDSTLVQWSGEFGRTPVAELPALNGRDHNHYGFTCWLAGGGAKGGTVVGATDDFGFAAAENKVHVHDLHATMLHLLGFDHEKLTYRYAGRDFRLTDVHGVVVKEMLA